MTRKCFAVFAACALLAAPVFAQKKADAAKGKEVFEQCTVCHETATDAKKLGPSLKGLFKKGKLASGKAVSDAAVIDRVNKGGNGMPAFADILSADERANLLAFLKTI